MFLLFIIMFFLVWYIKSNIEPTGYTGKREYKAPECPPHAWYWDDTGFLKCSLCNNRPQYESRENNK